MRYLLLMTFTFSVGCSTFNLNEAGVRKACNSNVKEYDDGSLNFKCFDKKEVGQNLK